MEKIDQINRGIIDHAFTDAPHDYFLVYDELTDELFIRLVQPDTVAFTYDLEDNNNFALLIEPKSNEIVGFHLYNFQTEHLPKWNALKESWYKDNLPQHFGSYRRFHYNPKDHQQHHHEPKPVDRNWQRQFTKSVAILEEALA